MGLESMHRLSPGTKQGLATPRARNANTVACATRPLLSESGKPSSFLTLVLRGSFQPRCHSFPAPCQELEGININ